MFANIDDPKIPRRGGSNSILGDYVGGTALNEFYALDPTEESYKCVLQLRNVKSLTTIESDL